MKLITLHDFSRGINRLWEKIKRIFATKEYVDEKMSQLENYTVDTIEPTTTNFIKDEEYTIHTALQRIANLFAGKQEQIQVDILDKIPEQATSQNKLADKAFVNSTVATNAANFRGNWQKWENVPVDASNYPEDYTGNKTPTNNDYLVVQDATDYSTVNDGAWRFIYVGTWLEDGKNGWVPQYRIGAAFTAEQQAAIDSKITNAKVNKYDGYEQSINNLETNKVTIINTQNKIYGTSDNGSQTVYTAGEGIQFGNSQVKIDASVVAKKTDPLSQFTNDLDYVVSEEPIGEYGPANLTSCYKIVHMENDPSTQFTIEPNKYYIFGNRSNITISLSNNVDETILNTFMFEFVATSANVFHYSGNWSWLTEPDVKSGKTYEVNVCRNRASITEWN